MTTTNEGKEHIAKVRRLIEENPKGFAVYASAHLLRFASTMMSISNVGAVAILGFISGQILRIAETDGWGEDAQSLFDFCRETVGRLEPTDSDDAARAKISGDFGGLN